MVSLASSMPLAEAAQPATPIPELDDAYYATQVLQLAAGRSEEDDDHDIEVKVNALGIETPQLQADDKRITSSAQSASTALSYHARTFSTASNDSASTALTDQSSILKPPSVATRSPALTSKPRLKDLNFSQYDRFLSQIGADPGQPKTRKAPPIPETSAQSLFSVKTSRSIFSVASGFKNKLRWRRKSFHPSNPLPSCVCCRDDFSNSNAVYTLPCNHTYCAKCLRVMIKQATADESKMPPRCCSQPIPAAALKALLERHTQQAFLKAVVQYSTPWESRIFCPDSSCGEFIPPRRKVDPKQPLNATCRKCETRVCVICKHDAHPIGKDCPEDWELEDVLTIGEKSGWRRCYKCRNLVELSQGCTQMTCTCKAEFCYICGGVWDAEVGCPNSCNGEEGLERRLLEEEERAVKRKAEKEVEVAAAAVAAAKRAEAEQRSNNHLDFQHLVQTQEGEVSRFVDFVAKSRIAYRKRHSTEKLALMENHADAETKMRERHARTAGHLEDRQIAAEMELRASLEQSERSVQIRLKHMEAYCDGLGRKPSSHSRMPPRTVTERDLRELGQQYNIRDDMSRLHQAKVNVMRDRQGKQMEDLIDRQEAERQKLAEKGSSELQDLVARFTHEEHSVNEMFKTRQERLTRRWELAIEILRKELEQRDGFEYGSVSPPRWPEQQAVGDDMMVKEAEE